LERAGLQNVINFVNERSRLVTSTKICGLC
jgi:hypothetical protein